MKKDKHKQKRDDVTIQFMPYSEIAGKNTIERIRMVMGLILDHKLIVLQGRLKPEEEAKLIENSMTLIGNIKDFQGIEIATISNTADNAGFFEKLRHGIAKILVGNQDAMTIIGPASIVKDMKKDPSKIEILLKK